jgi:hypothetical protein
MRKSYGFVLFTVFASITSSASQAPAQLILPIGLPHGTPYQLIFVTADAIEATSTNIDDYNLFVTEEARLNPMIPITTFHVVGSTNSLDANLNALSGGLPVYNTRGIRVAGPEGIYTGSILSPVAYDQFGMPVNGSVWTGSNADGTSNGPVTSLGDGLPKHGNSFDTNSSWLAGAVTSLPGEKLPLYALSTALVVTPEPGSLMLLGIGILAISGTRLLRYCRKR